MTAERFDPRRNRAELERRAERRRLKQIAHLLERARPEPSPDFRANLAQRLQVEPLERRRLLRTARLLEGCTAAATTLIPKSAGQTAQRAGRPPS